MEDYHALQRRIGTTRCVVILPSTYGTDNSHYLALLPQLGGKDRARMVGVVNTSVTDQELRQMHDAGVRGIRFNLSPPGATTLDMIEPLAKRIELMGWHCQINMPADQIVAAQEIFLRVPGRLVFDHLAHAPDVNGPGYQLIRRLIDKGNTWVKLSGAYADTKSGPPEYADRLAVAQGYASAAPERGLGQRLAASHRTGRQEAERCRAVRSAGGMGAGRGSAASCPGGKSGQALRFPRRMMRHCAGRRLHRRCSVAPADNIPSGSY